jgi:type IV pilus assembly protein PilE
MRTTLRFPKGFTLVELMITIMVAAILAAIAVPSYTNQVRKSRRTDARNAVLDAAAREERLFATNNRYSQVAADLGYTALPQKIGGGYYEVNVRCTPDVATCTGFVVTAAPLGNQVKDTACAIFQVDETGKQTVTGVSAADPRAPCWN